MVFFRFLKKSAKSAYLGKLISLNDEELIIDFLDTKGQFGGELSFNPQKSELLNLTPIISIL
jgi:hypothetical protein